MAGRVLSLEVAPSTACADGRSHLSAVPVLEDAPASSGVCLLELETTYSLRRPEVVRFLVQHGFDLVEAEDVTQEVFLNVLKTPERKRPTEYFFRWVLVCAKNLAIDRRRRSKREVLAPAALWKRWEETMGNAAPDAAFTLQERERFERFHQALAKLTAEEQKCVLLRSRGSTFSEVAEALEVPLRSAIYITNTACRSCNVC